MHCPYCTAEVPQGALVCKTCARDLYLLKPLQERIEELESRLAQQAQSLSAEYSGRIAALEGELSALKTATAAMTASAADAPEAQSSSAAGRARSYVSSLMLALFPALILLLAAHVVLLFMFDARPLYLRIASMLIPLPFGFALLVWHPRRIALSAIAGFVLAFVAVFTMLLTTARMDNVPVLPQEAREVREVLEYVASIGLAFLTGLLLGKLRVHRLHVGPRPNRAVVFLAQLFTTDQDGELGLVRVSNRIHRMVSSLTPLATAVMSVYAGVKALFGDGG
jgi:uncharacterized coiled-coil protein SlyX